MKKIRGILATLMAVVMLGTLLISCGDKNDKTAASSKAESSKSTSDNSSSEKFSIGKVASMEEYVKHPNVVQKMETMKASFKAQNMDMELSAEGDKLIYSVTYTIDLGDIAAAKPQLDSTMEAQRSTVQTALDMLKKEVDVEHPIIVYRYYTMDGELIGEYEFADEG